VVLVGEESVSGITGGSGPRDQSGEPTHAHIYHRQRRHRALPQGSSHSQRRRDCCRVKGGTARHPAQRQAALALWNALPGVNKRRRVGDRAALIEQLWSAIERLPDPELRADAKRPSKQDVVIAMLRQPEGATVDEVASVTGWQRHTVRGVFSGTLKKKLGLTLASAQEERGRVYRITGPAST